MIASHTVRRAALLAALLAVPGLQAAEVAGVRVPDVLRVGDRELLLNGAGLRSKLFIKVYVGALYVERKAASPEALLDGTGPRRMSLRLLRDLDAGSLQSALDDGLRDNHTPAQLAAIKPQADALAAIMKGIGQAREGDIIALDFPGDGVVVSVNGQARGEVRDAKNGAAFARALLKVWLGDKPADASLKKALLGQ